MDVTFLTTWTFYQRLARDMRQEPVSVHLVNIYQWCWYWNSAMNKREGLRLQGSRGPEEAHTRSDVNGVPRAVKRGKRQLTQIWQEKRERRCGIQPQAVWEVVDWLTFNWNNLSWGKKICRCKDTAPFNLMLFNFALLFCLHKLCF